MQKGLEKPSPDVNAMSVNPNKHAGRKDRDDGAKKQIASWFKFRYET